MNTQNKKVVLLVEDEEVLSTLIGAKFKKRGFKVVIAQTCEEALVHFHKLRHLSAVWLDHHLLGKKDGLDFVAETRSDQKKADIPIFVISNTGDHKKKTTYLNLGATEYFIKANHKLDDIIASIEKHVDDEG